MKNHHIRILSISLLLMHLIKAHFLGSSNTRINYLMDATINNEDETIFNDPANFKMNKISKCKLGSIDIKMPTFLPLLGPEREKFPVKCTVGQEGNEQIKTVTFYDQEFSTGENENILIIVSGSNFAYKIKEYIRNLKQIRPNSDIRMIVTYAASKFITLKKNVNTASATRMTAGSENIEGEYNQNQNNLKSHLYEYHVDDMIIPVYDDSWEWQTVNEMHSKGIHLDDVKYKDMVLFPPHSKLSIWADLLVFYPLGSNLMADVVVGKAYSLATLVSKAWQWGMKPTICMPSMTTWMFKNPSTLENVIKFSALGSIVILGNPNTQGVPIHMDVENARSPGIVAEPLYCAKITDELLKKLENDQHGSLKNPGKGKLTKIWDKFSYIIQNDKVASKDCKLENGELKCVANFVEKPGGEKNVQLEEMNYHLINMDYAKLADNTKNLWKISQSKKAMFIEVDMHPLSDLVKEKIEYHKKIMNLI